MAESKITPIIGNEFADKVIPLIKESKKTLDIIVYDWRWYPDQIGAAIQRFNNAIIKASQTGKRVRVITNSSRLDDILSKLEIKTKKWGSKKTLHTKLILIDGKIAVMGSHNYTMNAFVINYEISVIIQNVETVNRLNKYFENLWW